MWCLRKGLWLFDYQRTFVIDVLAHFLEVGEVALNNKGVKVFAIVPTLDSAGPITSASAFSHF